jgi:hypothetical protein
MDSVYNILIGATIFSVIKMRNTRRARQQGVGKNPIDEM